MGLQLLPMAPPLTWPGATLSLSSDTNDFRRYDLGSNAWTTLAPLPDIIDNASAVYSPINNKVYVFGGGNATTGVVSNATRIYDIATGTWSAGLNMPDVRSFMAEGYFNGKIYLVGGYSTGNISPAFAQVWEYDPIANTFNTTRLDMPAMLGGAGSAVINGHLYVAGGRDANNIVVNTLFDYDIAANTWTTRAPLLSADNVPGCGVLNGQLWIYGGGNPFGALKLPALLKSMIPPPIPGRPGRHWLRLVRLSPAQTSGAPFSLLVDITERRL